MPASDGRLIAALVAARTALDSALMALTEDVTKEESPATPETAEKTVREVGAGVTCKHSDRTEMDRTFGVAEHWVCNTCGYEYRR